VRELAPVGCRRPAFGALGPPGTRRRLAGERSFDLSSAATWKRLAPCPDLLLARLNDSKAASPSWLSSKNESLTRFEGRWPCQVSRCRSRAGKEAYASLSLTLVQSLKRLRIEPKCDDDEACVGSATVPGAAGLSGMLGRRPRSVRGYRSRLQENSYRECS
jgi:hypothetical protein